MSRREVGVLILDPYILSVWCILRKKGTFTGNATQSWSLPDNSKIPEFRFSLHLCKRDKWEIQRSNKRSKNQKTKNIGTFVLFKIWNFPKVKYHFSVLDSKYLYKKKWIRLSTMVTILYSFVPSYKYMQALFNSFLNFFAFLLHWSLPNAGQSISVPKP